MHRMMMTSAIVLAAAAFSVPAMAQDSNTTNQNPAQNQTSQQNQSPDVTGATNQTTAQMSNDQLLQACSQAWPVVDTNDDTKISKDEAQQATDVEFDRIDADGNGTITAAEWAMCAAPKLQESDTWTSYVGSGTEQDQFAAMDTDKSGEVSAQEAAEVSKQRYSGGKGNQAVQQGMMSGASFASIDSDGNGSISQNEWSNRQNASLEKRFTALDKDGNGQVSKSEFSDFRQQRFGEAQQAQGGNEPTLWIFYHYF